MSKVMKYKSLHSASGWTAVFHDKGEILTLTVAFFAVLESEFDERIVPLVPNDFGYHATHLTPASLMDGFLGIAAPGEDVDARWEKAIPK